MNLNEHDSKNVIENFMKEKKIQGKLIFSMVAGSQAFNTFFSHSDFDYFGVYIAPIENLLGIEPFLPEIQTTHDPVDITLYEIQNFCEGIKLGQPLLVQSLFCNFNLAWKSKEWDEILKFREIFINKQTIKGFISYLKNQMKLLKPRIVKYSKPLYHSFRLLFEIEEMINEKRLIVWFEGDKRDYLIGIRNQEKSREEYLLELKERLLNLNFENFKGEKEFKLLKQWLIESRIKE